MNNSFVCDKVMSLKSLGPASSMKARIDGTDKARPCKRSKVENHVINTKHYVKHGKHI